jgi:hypothetical protein
LTSPQVTPSAQPQVTEQDIQHALTDYQNNVPQLLTPFIQGPPAAEENYQFNRFGQDSYLLCSRYSFHQLPVPLLRRLPIYLTKQFSVQVEIDSGFYWALTHDVAFQSHVLQQWYLFSSLQTLFSAHFAKTEYATGYPPVNAAITRINRIILDAIPPASMNLLTNSHVVLMYTCYPVLEGILKLLLNNYVNENGLVLAQFSDGTTTHYLNSTISSLSVYLHALETNATQLVAKPDLATDLRDFRAEMESDFAQRIAASNQSDAWNWIYSLRNASLHGAIGWQLRSGLMTNLVCMLIWHILENAEAASGLQQVSENVMRHFPFSFQNAYYPPDI